MVGMVEAMGLMEVEGEVDMVKQQLEGVEIVQAAVAEGDIMVVEDGILEEGEDMVMVEMVDIRENTVLDMCLDLDTMEDMQAVVVVDLVVLVEDLVDKVSV